MPHTETARGTIFYTLSQGPAECPTLLLIHGAGGSRLHWPAELRRLPGAAVYTLDLPGHGRSEGDGCDTITDYAKAVVGFLDAVNVERAIVVGHSMGGAIAQTLALDYAARVAGLALVGSGARLRVAPAIIEGIQNDLEGSAGLITQFAWSPDAPSALTELGRQTILETGPDVLWGDFVACDRFDVMERLAEITAPTLVIAGAADQLTPPKYARFLIERIPQAQLVLIEGAGHMVMLERPVKVAKAVNGFLSTL